MLSPRSLSLLRRFTIGLIVIFGGMDGKVRAQEIVSNEPLKSPSPTVKEAMPTAPKDGILDNAEVFTPAQRRELVAKIAQFARSDDFHIFVATYTFVYGEEARQRAWRLGQKWLEGKQGAVVVFDKGGGGTSPAVGLIWQQDDQRALQDRTIQGILAAASSAASAQPTEAPAKQISAAVQELVAGYGRVRPVLEEGRRAARTRQYIILGGVLGVMFFSLLILGLVRRFQRRAEKRNAESYLFPHVEIAPRYDAPFGGGVVVQMHYGRPGSLPTGV